VPFLTLNIENMNGMKGTCHDFWVICHYFWVTCLPLIHQIMYKKGVPSSPSSGLKRGYKKLPLYIIVETFCDIFIYLLLFEKKFIAFN